MIYFKKMLNQMMKSLIKDHFVEIEANLKHKDQEIAELKNQIRELRNMLKDCQSKPIVVDNHITIKVDDKYDSMSPLQAYWESGSEKHVINPTSKQLSCEPIKERGFRMKVKGMLEDPRRTKSDKQSEADLRDRCSKHTYQKTSSLNMDFGKFKLGNLKSRVIKKAPRKSKDLLMNHLMKRRKLIVGED